MQNVYYIYIYIYIYIYMYICINTLIHICKTLKASSLQPIIQTREIEGLKSSWNVHDTSDLQGGKYSTQITVEVMLFTVSSKVFLHVVSSFGCLQVSMSVLSLCFYYCTVTLMLQWLCGFSHNQCGFKTLVYFLKILLSCDIAMVAMSMPVGGGRGHSSSVNILHKYE